MHTIMVIIGTRPEAIKMAPVIRALQRQGADFRVLTCLTAQHRELLDQVVATFGLKVDVDLNLMTPGQSLVEVTARVLEGVSAVLEEHKPDAVLVHGDTTTTFAAALAAYYQRIPVGHVEAGLRTYDPYHPFPEEMNRRLCDHLARFHYAPTEAARGNLLQEHIPAENIIVTGNTVIDALLSVADAAHHFDDPVLEGLGKDRKLILATVHRRENFGAPLAEVCGAMQDIVAAHADVEIALTVHPNPNVQSVLQETLGKTERIHLLPPQEYVPFVHLMKKSTLILSDSGGIQEEAPALGKPVLVLRDQTERPEAVEAGTARLVGTKRGTITSEVARLLEDESAYTVMARATNPFGDGKAAERIVNHLASVLRKG